jgi:hypothetical protein
MGDEESAESPEKKKGCSKCAGEVGRRLRYPQSPSQEGCTECGAGLSRTVVAPYTQTTAGCTKEGGNYTYDRRRLISNAHRPTEGWPVCSMNGNAED